MIEIENNQPDVIIQPQQQNVILLTQTPGVGPPGPAGPPGESGVGAVDFEARDMISLHLIDVTPHPVYDDIPDLVLLFENGLI